MEFDFEKFLSKDAIQRNTFTMWAMIILILLGLAGIVFMIVRAPPPAEFERVELLTPTVTPTLKPLIVNKRRIGAVRIQTLVSSNVDWKCLVSSQYLIDMSDGSTWQIPGFRTSQTIGDFHKAQYFAFVPWDAPAGQSQFYVIDTYGCTIRNQRVVTPRVQFTILPAITK